MPLHKHSHTTLIYGKQKLTKEEFMLKNDIKKKNMSKEQNPTPYGYLRIIYPRPPYLFKMQIKILLKSSSLSPYNDLCLDHIG